MSRVLTVLRLGQEHHYSNYYRVLNRVGWSGLAGTRILLGLILTLLLKGQPLVIGVDEWSQRIL